MERRRKKAASEKKQVDLSVTVIFMKSTLVQK
jgi:hypothetical protein